MTPLVQALVFFPPTAIVLNPSYSDRCQLHPVLFVPVNKERQSYLVPPVIYVIHRFMYSCGLSPGDFWLYSSPGSGPAVLVLACGDFTMFAKQGVGGRQELVAARKHALGMAETATSKSGIGSITVYRGSFRDLLVGWLPARW